MNYDGWVTIGTDLDSKEFDKEIKRLEKESSRLAKEQEKLLNQKSKLEIDTSKAEKDMDNLNNKIENVKKKLQQEKVSLSNIPEWKQDTPEYSKQNSKVGDLQVQYDTLVSKSDVLNEKYQVQATNLEKINQKLKENATNQEMVKNELEETEAKAMGLHLNFDNIGKSIMDNVKKVGKWALAVFSLRSAYNAVRQAMSTISTYNDDLNNKLYSIKMMFATALEPLVTRLVNLAWKLMSYVAYIAKAWFGVDLYAKSSANAIKAGAKSAEKMKKSLTGFDEATVLNENGTTGSMGGSSSQQFMAPEEAEIPSWIKWIADNKDLILSFLKQLGLIIGGLKLAKMLGIIGNIGKKLKTVFGFLKNMSGLQIFVLIAGVVITLTGIVTLIQGIIAFIKDPSWKNFNKILEGLTLILLGVAAAMIAFNATNPVGWIVLAAGAVTGLVTIFSTLGQKLLEDKAHILSLKDAQEQLKKAQDDLKKSTDEYISAVDNAEEAERKLIEAEKKNKMSGAELQKQVDEGKLSYENMTAAQREVWKAYRDNINAQDTLKTATENLTNAKKAETKASWENELAIAKESGNYEEFKKKVVDAYKNGSLSAEEARTLIERSMAGMSDASKQTFMKDLPDDIKNGLNPNRYESTFNNFKNSLSGVWSHVKDTAWKAWNTIKGWFSSGVEVPMSLTSSNSSLLNTFTPSKRGHAKGAIVYPQIQYHASGGIINQPGRGVPITQHVGGERGAEGIVPLTDSQQMDLLGQSIARHMIINLTNITQMNGRVLSREIKKIQTEQDFATNS